MNYLLKGVKGPFGKLFCEKFHLLSPPCGLLGQSPNVNFAGSSQPEGLKTAYIGIGSNLGSRIENCKKAVALMGEYGINIEASSSMIETSPWAVKDQPDFINMCVKVNTNLSPHKLLETLLEIEQKVGRTKTYRWGPRIIDLDILLYGNDIIIDDTLRIPHAQLHRREFVLRTLNEIAGDVLHPEFHLTIKTLFEEIRINSF